MTKWTALTKEEWDELYRLENLVLRRKDATVLLPRERERVEKLMSELVEATVDGNKRLWPDKAYEQGYHTVPECEVVIKSLRYMVDRQQEYINKLLLIINSNGKHMQNLNKAIGDLLKRNEDLQKILDAVNRRLAELDSDGGGVLK